MTDNKEQINFEINSWKSKKVLSNIFFSFSLITLLRAQDKTRTCTPKSAPAPQAGVSTNSTTWAFLKAKLQFFQIIATYISRFVPETGLEPAQPCDR